QQSRLERRLGTLEVVLRDLAADRDSRAYVQARLDSVRHGPADIVEVHVDARGDGGLQRLRKPGVLVVDRSVVAERLGQQAQLLRAARNPDRSAAGDLRELADDLAYAPGRGRHDNGVAGRGPPDVEESEVRRQPIRAEDVQ